MWEEAKNNAHFSYHRRARAMIDLLC
jgi:hypothetical protein